MALSRDLIEPKSEKESGNNLLMVGGLVAVAGIISLILKKQKENLQQLRLIKMQLLLQLHLN